MEWREGENVIARQAVAVRAWAGDVEAGLDPNSELSKDKNRPMPFRKGDKADVTRRMLVRFLRVCLSGVLAYLQRAGIQPLPRYLAVALHAL